jgi:hypothetical protein
MAENPRTEVRGLPVKWGYGDQTEYGQSLASPANESAMS